MNNWCGEFQAFSRKPKQQIEIIHITQPEKPTNKYDIETDTIVYDPAVAKDILATMADALTAEPFKTPAKKPGRPKKVAK